MYGRDWYISLSSDYKDMKNKIIHRRSQELKEQQVAHVI